MGNKISSIEEPDDVNNFTKSLAHMLNFESSYCPYYILFSWACSEEDLPK